MPIEVLLVQLLVLVFTGALWWIARRDLAARIPPPTQPTLPGQTADMAELEQLCATLEILVTSLARRLDSVEAALPPTELNQAGREEAAQTQLTHPVTYPGPAAAAVPEPSRPEPSRPELPTLVPKERVPEPEPDPRYSQVYALLDRGVSDPIEIARQTTLSRGEVDLILSLRGRRAL